MSRRARNVSRAYEILKELEVGQLVPLELYVLDRADGVRPPWRVGRRIEREAGVLFLELVDDDQPEAAVGVVTCARFTRRTRPYERLPLAPFLGAGNTLCDMDQQARHVAREAAA